MDDRNKSRVDVHVNMLRLTTEALAAAIGGVDSIQLSPFDQPLGSSNDFARRLARNLQLILQEELQLIQLIDPAGGAWHVEKLTDQLARAAWSLFQTIEADGGMLACLQSGFIQAHIESVAEGRKRDLSTRDAILVGSNKYIDSDVTLPAIQPPLGEYVYADEDTLRVQPLTPLRLCERFESTAGKFGHSIVNLSPDFSKIAYDADSRPGDFGRWRDEIAAKTGTPAGRAHLAHS